MDKDERAGEGGDRQGKPPGPPQDPAFQRQGAKPQEENITTNTPRRNERHSGQKPTWTDKVQAYSAALVFAATVVNVFTTCSIRDITQQYTTYTKAQATAEAISAKAAKSEATAAATEAADETKSANAARDAVRIAATAQAGQVAQAKAEAAQSSQQLEAIKKSVAEQGRFAAASERGTVVSARALADHEAEVRAHIKIDGSVDDSSGAIVATVYLHSSGQTAARQIVVNAGFRPYGWGATPGGAIQRQNEVFSRMLLATPQRFAYLSPGDGHSLTMTVPSVPVAVWNTVKHTPGGWVLVGMAEYDDIFGRSHLTSFCTYEIGADNAGYCPFHNGESDYTKPSRRSTHRRKKPW
jgi:hypothetical protein